MVPVMIGKVMNGEIEGILFFAQFFSPAAYVKFFINSRHGHSLKQLLPTVNTHRYSCLSDIIGSLVPGFNQ
jgi:hypothetical protein